MSDYENESDSPFEEKDSDTESVAETVMDVNIPANENLEDVVGDFIDNLTEKSAATREKSLVSLRKLILTERGVEIISQRSEVVFDYTLKCLRKGAESERKSALELISSLFFMIGPDSEEVYRNTFTPLRDTIRDHKSDLTKIASLKTLSFACFLASTEDESTMGALSFFEEVFSRNGEPIVMAQAIDAWCLIASTISEDTLSELATKNMKIFKKHLSSQEFELRMSAGVAIALLSEGIDDETYTKFISDEILDLVEELSKDSDRRKGKKEKNKQRSMFRDILFTLEKGSQVIEKLNLKGETLIIDSWSKWVRLNALRGVLGGTAPNHLKSNQTIRDMFDMPPASLVDGQKMSAEEKKLYRSQASAVSKERSQSRTQKRQNKISRTLTED